MDALKVLTKEGTLFGMVLSGMAYTIIWYAGVNFNSSTSSAKLDKLEAKQQDQSMRLETMELSVTKDMGDIKGDIKMIRAILEDRHQR